MKKSYIYFQPEYVSKFQCDGQACNAHCCRNWNIDIDKKTYKKYSAIKPKSNAREITKKIKFDNKVQKYRVILNEKLSCPFLTEDNWCSIQRTYGEDFLSNICTTYPRVVSQVGDFFERTLTLSCPVAANLILRPTEPMAFEQIELSEIAHRKSCKENMLNIKDQSFSECIINIQYAVISILQERNLTIDQRLIIVGYFFDQLEELLNADKMSEVETLAKIFSSEDFLKTQALDLVNSIDFNIREYIELMINILEKLYGDNEALKFDARDYIIVVIQMLEIKTDKNNTASITELVNTYKKYSSEREKFLERHSTLFENYLVQEFFAGMYPCHVEGSIKHNYGVFLITYKVLELMAVARSVMAKRLAKSAGIEQLAKEEETKDLIKLISWFSVKIDHSKNYMNPISEWLKDREDIIKIMRALLEK
ncbi:MAG: flagellin lysine-N-methylase [Selenomonadaceae bacterium]|nr:flagellin lysine-N-methylase [Selenomonadaceae bacterium]